MKVWIACFMVGIGLLSCKKIPQYFTIDDYLLFTMRSANSDCDSLFKSNSYHQSEMLHIYFLFSVNYVDKARKGDNRYFEPGGFGENGLLDSINEFRVVLLDEKNKTSDITSLFFRDTVLNKVYVRGKGLMNYLYDKDCEPIGLPFNNFEEFVHAINQNRRDIHFNNLVNKGLALSLKLENIPKGKYILKSDLIFRDNSISKKMPIEIL